MGITKVKKIISGGQTGVDRIGLEVGKELGLETGGTAPPNFYTENGNDYTLISFGVKEISRELQQWADGNKKLFYLPRTEQNVINSDGTVYFSASTESAGRKATESFANKHNKPFIFNPSTKALRQWLIDNNIETLNVAGNRKSHLPKDNKVKLILIKALTQE